MPQKPTTQDDLVFVDGVGAIPEAQARQMQTTVPNQPQVGPQDTLNPPGQIGIQGPRSDQFAGIKLPPGQDLERSTAGMLHALPQVAGMATMAGPAASLKGAMAIPAIVQLLQSIIEGERDPANLAMGAGEQALMSGALHGVGQAIKLPLQGFGKQKVLNVVGGKLGPEYAEPLANTAIQEGADLSAAGINQLKDKAKDYFARGRMGRGYGVEDLIEQLQKTSPKGGGAIPIIGEVFHGGEATTRLSGGGSSMLSPKSSLRLGRAVHNAAQPAQLGVEGILRGLLSMILGEDTAESPTDQPPSQPEKPTTAARVPYQGR